jgi:hypothetical protein
VFQPEGSQTRKPSWAGREVIAGRRFARAGRAPRLGFGARVRTLPFGPAHRPSTCASAQIPVALCNSQRREPPLTATSFKSSLLRRALDCSVDKEYQPWRQTVWPLQNLVHSLQYLFQPFTALRSLIHTDHTPFHSLFSISIPHTRTSAGRYRAVL